MLNRRAMALAAVMSLAGSGLGATRIADEPETILRFENARVRVVEIVYQPGDTAPEHTHRYPRAVYAITPGTLELSNPDGSRVTVELAAGQTVWRPRETHSVSNVGATVVRVLETEIK